MSNVGTTLDAAHIETLDADPYLTWIFRAGDGFVQVTNYGGFNEQFDIEIHSELHGWGEPWTLWATAYGRPAMRQIVKSIIAQLSNS